MRYQTKDLDIPAGSGNGDTFNCSELVDKWVQCAGGGFTSTVKLQGTVNGNDWIDIATLTDGSMTEVPGAWRTVRVNLSGSIGGSPTVTMAGRDARTD